MSGDVCMRHCQPNYQYAGVSVTGCYCGYKIDSEKVIDTECKKNCPDSQFKGTCGSYMKMSVYKTKKILSVTEEYTNRTTIPTNNTAVPVMTLGSSGSPITVLYITIPVAVVISVVCIGRTIRRCIKDRLLISHTFKHSCYNLSGNVTSAPLPLHDISHDHSEIVDNDDMLSGEQVMADTAQHRTESFDKTAESRHATAESRQAIEEITHAVAESSHVCAASCHSCSESTPVCTEESHDYDRLKVSAGVCFVDQTYSHTDRRHIHGARGGPADNAYSHLKEPGKERTINSSDSVDMDDSYDTLRHNVPVPPNIQRHPDRIAKRTNNDTKTPKHVSSSNVEYSVKVHVTKVNSNRYDEIDIL